jgi:hypothetical protein
MLPTDTLNTARVLVERYGRSVIPLRPNGKRPSASWKPYQHRHPTAQELDDWFASGRANIGIVTGEISGLVVIDIDGPVGEAALRDVEVPRTVAVETPRPGRHLYFKHPGRYVHNGANLLPGIDVRGDGGYVVAPPSRVDGTPYAYIDMPKDVELARLPEWFWRIPPSRARAAVADSRVSDGAVIEEGWRNSTLAHIAGYMRRPGCSVEAIDAALQIENRGRCRPPLPREEVRAIAESIGRYAAGDPW